jgi:hypothetical protein
MSHHVTEGDSIANAAAPLACPHCGCTDLLHAVELVAILSATAHMVDGRMPDDGSGQPLREAQHWPERGWIVCRNCGQIEMRFDQLVPAALPPSSASTPGAAS